ncbi:hypothetical protein PAALTS15_09289 [Paenibacillus alvei TS-15]|uniref:Uncharacterized protein n=1 Tax=Paenibacillus alvei TS-15 TaxID=1117108 RepID=S9TZF5_PAEAL|nr:hypothetical protein [Paenibacillus alvei]EPY07581.1 hypothetical protein PAALTS15_09289 [Paenibacillus alvei TS-15]
MIVPAHLDGAKVIMYVDNDVNRPIAKMLYEEDNGSSKEIIITGLALAKYDNSNDYYLFLCDKNWEVCQDFDIGSIEEALHSSIASFELDNSDWKYV